MFSIFFVLFVLSLLSLSLVHSGACSLRTPFLCYLTPIARLPIMATSVNTRHATVINGGQWIKRSIVGRIIIQAQRVKRWHARLSRAFNAALYRVVVESTRADILRTMATISGWIAFIIAIGGCASNGDDLGVAPLLGMAALPVHRFKGTLLTVAQGQTKLIKSMKRKISICGVNLAPWWASFRNLCSHEDGCGETCLSFTGRNRFGGSARLKRTYYMLTDKIGFKRTLTMEIAKWARRWARKGYALAMRPNLLSDLPWLGRFVAETFPEIQVYDYTKIPEPWKRITDNYHLTFSLGRSNDAAAYQALVHGVNVAMCIDVKPGDDLPRFAWLGGALWPVIDGDKDDYRPNDPQGVIVGLRLKGTNAAKEIARGDEIGTTIEEIDGKIRRVVVRSGFARPVVSTVWGMVANHPIAPLALPAPSVKRSDRGLVPTIKLIDAVAYVPETIEEIRAYDRSYQSLGNGGSRRVNVGGAE